jgi:hypothetical protein
MGCAEVISFEEVRARKPWGTLRQQLHTRFDQWLDVLEERLREPEPTLAAVTETIWALRQQLTGGLTESLSEKSNTLQGLVRPLAERLMVVSAPGCHAAEGEPSSTVSAWRVAGPPGGGDGALQADRGLPCHAGHAPRVGLWPRPTGVHHGGLQGVGPVAWLSAACSWLRAPLASRV